MLQDIVEKLPNIPEEVIRLWILGLAKHNGWPPSVENQWDLRITGEKFSFWNDAAWEKTSLNLGEILYSKGYYDTMRGLRDAYLKGVENDYWKLLGEDGKERFKNCFRYILKNQKFPAPPVLSPNEVGEYEVLDGNHRFLAFIAAENAYNEYQVLPPETQRQFLLSFGSDNFCPPCLLQEVWVCKPNWANSSQAIIRTFLRNNTN